MCFTRMVNGRRIIDRYVRRTFPTDSLARCQLACTIEREFICEGFNYRWAIALSYSTIIRFLQFQLLLLRFCRFSSNPEIGNSCQLTAMPGMNLDLTLDFTSDVDYDFYTRDRNAPAACGHLSYKTWNYGYDRRTNIAPNDWWQKPTVLPADQPVNLPPPTPIDIDDIYRNRWNSHGYGKWSTRYYGGWLGFCGDGTLENIAQLRRKSRIYLDGWPHQGLVTHLSHSYFTPAAIRYASFCGEGIYVCLFPFVGVKDEIFIHW